jgi:hypothetical protein
VDGDGLATMMPHDRRWPASVTVLSALVLQLLTPKEARVGPAWLLPALEGVLILPLVVTNPFALRRQTQALRWIAVGLSVLLAGANAVDLMLLVGNVQRGSMNAAVLVRAAALIWVTNVAAVAVALWEMDGGGPFARRPDSDTEFGTSRPDLLFPQMTGVPGWDRTTWRPGFADYLFVAFTSATAFSPTDTLPLSARAKVLMTLGSAVSLVTLGVVVARAVNVA